LGIPEDEEETNTVLVEDRRWLTSDALAWDGLWPRGSSPSRERGCAVQISHLRLRHLRNTEAWGSNRPVLHSIGQGPLLFTKSSPALLKRMMMVGMAPLAHEAWGRLAAAPVCPGWLQPCCKKWTAGFARKTSRKTTKGHFWQTFSSARHNVCVWRVGGEAASSTGQGRGTWHYGVRELRCPTRWEPWFGSREPYLSQKEQHFLPQRPPTTRAG